MTDANNNFVPDCDLLDPGLQDQRTSGGDLCAALSNQNFGKAVFSNTIDPDILSGRGVRGADWQIGASVQQEVLPARVGRGRLLPALAPELPGDGQPQRRRLGVRHGSA